MLDVVRELIVMGISSTDPKWGLPEVSGKSRRQSCCPELERAENHADACWPRTVAETDALAMTSGRARSPYALGFGWPICLHDVTRRHTKTFAELGGKVTSAGDPMVKQNAGNGV